MDEVGGDNCNAVAMALVALQLFLVVLSSSMLTRQPKALAVVTSGRSLACGLLVIVGGALLSRGNPLAGWLVFTAGAMVLGAQFTRYKYSSWCRGLVQTCTLLAIAAMLAPFVNYYRDAGGVLLAATMALLVCLIMSLAWPCPKLDGIVSAAGSAIFAVWTVHDVVARPCTSCWQKSIEVFLDIFNLLAFSVR